MNRWLILSLVLALGTGGPESVYFGAEDCKDKADGEYGAAIGKLARREAVNEGSRAKGHGGPDYIKLISKGHRVRRTSGHDYRT